MNIFNIGLKPYQIDALDQYFIAREAMTLVERRGLEDPVEYKEESINSKCFAFWFVLRKIIQDRPLFFWAGVAAFVYLGAQLFLAWVAKLLG